MTTPADDELLHRALDGALTAAEATYLRGRLAEDLALRERAEALRRVTEAVDGLGMADLPSGFADRVMEAVAAGATERPTRWRWMAAQAAAIGHQLFGGLPHHSRQDDVRRKISRWTTGMAGGGAIVAKKALWAVAGLAVIAILAAVYFNGTRSVDQGAQGTIGAADRYRGAQPTSVDAKGGDAQKFLQSDTFDKIAKDKNMRGLLSNPEYCAILATAEAEAALGSPEVEAALHDQATRAIFRSAAVQAALRDQGARDALADADVQAALRDQAKLQLALDGAVEAAMNNAAAHRALQNPAALAAALKNLPQAGVTRASVAGSADVEAALKDPAARLLLTNLRVQEALKNSSAAAVMAYMAKSALFQAMIADGAFKAALRSDNLKFSALFGNRAFLAAASVNGGKFAQMIGDDSFQAAFDNASLFAALGGGNARAALGNFKALQAAMARAQ